MKIFVTVLVAALFAAPTLAQEKIEFDSYTPTGYFALAKKELGTPVKVSGTLVLPNAVSGRIPAMVIAHGSGGVTRDREFWWAENLKRIGVASFIVDSFGPRGVTETATDQSRVPTAANLADALAALKRLAADPRIDPARIGVMGFSKGGQVAIYTALEPFRSAIAGAAKFALHVPLYPYCSDWQVSERVTGAPMLFLLGGKDDYTPAKPCQDYAAWFKSKGVQTQVTVYPNAYHLFDGEGRVSYAANVLTGKNCDALFDLDKFQIKIRANGEDITRKIQEYVRGCFTRGANLGGDPEARKRAPEDVAAFLKTNFKL
jgi:dienelactone hydrolase